MLSAKKLAGLAVGCLLVGAGAVLVGATATRGEDWPQWRGANRDARVAGFQAPAVWPKELTKKWSMPVGNGDATPALVGDKLYVFGRDGDQEVLRCLDAASGKELWKDGYAAKAVTGAAQGHPGPRSSPAVADGKVVTLGVAGTVSCWDTAGKLAWRKESAAEGYGDLPKFFTSMSPVIVDGLAVVHIGGGGNGAIVAFDLAKGDQKWKWTGDGPAYASPAIMTVGGSKIIISQTDKNMVAVAAADGKEVWKSPFPVAGMGYNAASPVIDGQILYYTGQGRGMHAVKFEKQGEAITTTDVWNNSDVSTQFSTPVLKDGKLYALAMPAGGPGGGGGGRGGGMGAPPAPTPAPAPAPAAPGVRIPGLRGGLLVSPFLQAPGGGGRMGGAPGGRMGGGRGGSGYFVCIDAKDGKTLWTDSTQRGTTYGSMVDAGPVLFSLVESSQLTVFQPDATGYKELASYKVSDKKTYSYPIISGNRIYIRDVDNVTLWTIE